MYLPHRLLLCLALLVVCAGILCGQTATGTLTGRVVDPSGAAVVGAEVRLINQQTRDTRRLLSDAEGDFVFSDVHPGTFMIAVKADGFKQLERTNVNLSPSDRLATGDLRLEVGTVAETVEVTAVGSPIQTASTERSSLIDSKQMTELMAKGRDVMALLQLLPGVVDDATGSETLGQFQTPTVGGVRQYYNALNIDGISGNTARGRTAESPINMDAISEVKVLTNSYPAEYGTAAGMVINLVTKGGTQKFRGSAYYYNRNEAYNANTFFNNRQSVLRQRYRYNTSGYNLGGPIYWPNHFNTNKQKLFFFFSQEILPNQSPNSLRTYTVPTELERKGDFSQSYRAANSLYLVKDPLGAGNCTTTDKTACFANNMIPAARLDANSAKLLTVFPLPNATDLAVTKYAYNFQIAGSQDIPVMQEILRVDYNISDKARLWVRGSGFSSENRGLTSAAIQNQWGPAPVGYAQTMPNIGGTFTYIFSPTLVNEATVGLNLWTENQKLTKEGLAAYQRTTYGINIPQTYPKDNPLGLLPAMSFSGVSSPAQITYDGRFPMVDDSTALSFSDGLSKVVRNHQFKVGMLVQHVQYNQYHQAGGANFPGNFNFGTSSSNPLDTAYPYANAFLGIYQTYTEATNRVDYAPVTRIAEWYAQDSWRVRRRVTMDVGLRFTWALPQTPANKQAANFVPSLWDPAKAPKLYRPAKSGSANVTINPITGATVLAVYSGLLVPNSGDPTNGVLVSGTKGYPDALVYSNGILYAPRFGLAWDPFGNGKTAIRFGGGFFYNPRADAGALGNLSFNPPLIFNPTAYYGYVAQAANSSGLLSPSSFSRTLDMHGKTVTAYHAHFGVQRQVIFGTVVDVSYVGSFGRHLGENTQINTVPYGAQFLPQNQNPQSSTPSPLPDNYFRPYPGYNNIPRQIFEGTSSYHSLQVTVNRRFAKGLQFGVVYTRSKALGFAEGDSTAAPSGHSNEVAMYQNRRIWNYGLSSYDRPNILTFNFLWEVPKLSRVLPNPVVKALFDNWQISDITSFISGAPVPISAGTSPSLNITGGGDGWRPIMTGNPILPKNKRTFDEYYDTTVFMEPYALTPGQTSYSPTWLNVGNMPRLIVRGPGTNNWNTSLFKNFIIKERLRFQLRAEAYNAFNHTQFSGLDTTITFNAARQNSRTSSGQITSARNPRVMQFALRLNF
jgi:hypothetical protein